MKGERCCSDKRSMKDALPHANVDTFPDIHMLLSCLAALCHSPEKKQNIPFLSFLDSREQEDTNAVLTDYFKTIECETESNGFTSKRCGKVRDDGVARPVLVVVKKFSSRTQILENVKVAKPPGRIASLKTKKDVHPGIRKEWGRMYKAYEDLKAAEGNKEKKRCIRQRKTANSD